MTVTTRFAPSPTGPLHLGHAFAAIYAHDIATRHDGRFLVRIEDLDQSRSRPHWESRIFEDLAWLGLDWEKPVMRQSERSPAYRRALATLWDRGLIYACSCTRRDIAISAPQEGEPIVGPDGIVYPGTCNRPENYCQGNDVPRDTTLRLNMTKALRGLDNISFEEHGQGKAQRPSLSREAVLTTIGDVAVARKGMDAAYHLAVVVDDAAQDITHVTRGEDLLSATFIHVVLQNVLGLPTPIYHHHRLIRDDTGKRLAKRDDAQSLETFRQGGGTTRDITALLEL